MRPAQTATRQPPFHITTAVREEIERIVDKRIREAHVTREDFSELKGIVAELAAAQKELTAAQQRTEQRVEELAAAQAELTEAQKRTETRLGELTMAIKELAEAQKLTEQEIRRVAYKQGKMEIRLDRLVGQGLEREYHDKANAYLGKILRGVRAVAVQELEADLEQHLSGWEVEDLNLLDVLLRGKPRQPADAPEVWLALEVSAVVDRNDVERAQRRAALLRKAGYRAIHAVAGEETTMGGEDMARDGNVLLIRDGKRQFWDEALAQVLAA